MNLKEIQPPLRFQDGTEHIWEALSKIPRTGWVDWGIPDPETVAEHILATRKLAVLLQDSLNLGLEDLSDVLNLIEVHDWSKINAGDKVVLGDEVDADELYEERRRAENKAMQEICSTLKEGEMVFALYERFQTGLDKNAVIAKEFGLYQTVLTAKEYEEKYQKEGLLKEFIHYTEDYISIPYLKVELQKLKDSNK